ncbi:unnamed protein product, partial [Symbiodinium sp. KB8]
MMDSDDENLSVHSAISNPSDFAEDEEVDYLALELLHHLPSEKADKLMKSLRAKEKAVQAAPKKEPEPVKEEPKPEEKPAEPKAEEQATVAEQVQAAAEKVMAAAAEMVGYGDQTPVAALDLQTGAEVTNIRSGMSGKVLEQKATEALVKYDDGKAEWTEIAALKLTDKPSEVVDDKAITAFQTAVCGTLRFLRLDVMPLALDDENQALTERLKEAEDVAAKVPEPAPAPKAPQSAPVDNSFFLQMERGKEETILRLTSENHKLAEQVRRLSEGCKQMEEALVQARKDMKRVQQSQTKQTVQTSGSPQLDEEERLYRELQGESMGDLILQKLQEKQAEHRLKIQQALQASLTEEIGRIESWGSDVKGVLLAVDGLETQLKHQLKEPKSKKAKAQPGDKDSKALNSEHVSVLSAQVLDEFDTIKRSLETVEKEQLSLEQTLRAADESAEPVAVAFELESFAIAESEAEWLREHNAAWVERCQSLSLKPMLDVLMRTDSALAGLLCSAPPGLIPPTVEDGLKETRTHMNELSEQLQVQMSSIAQLQEESAALSRTVTSLQASQKAHKSELQQNVSDSLRRTLATFEEPLAGMRGGLRQQSQVLSRARTEVARVLDDLAAVTHRAAAAVSQGSSKETPTISSELQDFVLSEIRQVRSMGKKLVGNLEEGCKAVEMRMQKVMEAISGDPKSQSQSRQVASSKQGERENQTEAKKKRKKKGGGHAAKGGGEDKEHEDEIKSAEAKPAVEAEASHTADLGAQQAEEKKADAQLCEEFQEAESPTGKSKSKRSGDRDKVLAGADLLQELQSLRSDTEALEARMAERMQVPPSSCGAHIRAALAEKDKRTGPSWINFVSAAIRSHLRRTFGGQTDPRCLVERSSRLSPIFSRRSCGSGSGTLRPAGTGACQAWLGLPEYLASS